MVRVTSHPRLYVAGRRIHHGLTGSILILTGMILAVHDRHDFPWTPWA